MGTITNMKGIKELPKNAPKTVRSIMDTLLLTPEGVDQWKKPSFQRPLKVTPKVQALVDELKESDGVIPGVITIGVMRHEKYLIDGQHRVEAFKLTGLKEGYADVRLCHFDSMADMGEEFVRLNSALVRLQTDDILRGLEGSHIGLQMIRRRCPFVGYGQLRRKGATGAGRNLTGMSAAISSWMTSATDHPGAGLNTHEAVKRLDESEAKALCDFLQICFTAWGSEPENFRLWTRLNVSICAWLWRRVVTGAYSVKTTRLSREQFTKCLMALSANQHYLSWLVGRSSGERDRSPCYQRMKTIFAQRIKTDGYASKVCMPDPPWSRG